jgi:hypothetical protein
LLHAKDDQAAAAGMWIASELGRAAKPLFEDIVRLMSHSALKVRFYSLDCVLVCAESKDEGAINLGLDLIEDPESAVRWKALVFLAALNDTVLRTALSARMKRDGVRQHEKRLAQLLDSATSLDVPAVLLALTDSDPKVRRFGAGMAARMAKRNPRAISLAAESSDPTISQFAADMMARLGAEKHDPIN